MARRRLLTLLDLNDFTTLIYYNLGYNLFTLRQSSRRSWRINQTAPQVEVYFFYYKDTIQERALSLMASKLAAAGLIEGQITDEGLAAMSDCQDLTSQLARELTKGIRTEVEDLASVFKRMAILKTGDEKKTFSERKAALPQPGSVHSTGTRAEQRAPVWAQATGIPHADNAVPAASRNDSQQAGIPAGNTSPVYAEGFVFTVPKPARKSKAPVQVEDQLSFFDQSA